MSDNYELIVFPNEPKHDYGGAFGKEVSGREFPQVRAGGRSTSPEFVRIPPGPSVSPSEKAIALSDIARIYGHYDKRKPDTHYSQARERSLLQPLLKERELIDIGFEVSMVDLAALSLMSHIRQLIGVSLSDAERQKNLERLLGHRDS